MFNAQCSMSKSRRSGMTLVEVIVAVLILGVSLGVLMTSAAQCLKILTLAKNHQKAEWALGMGEAEFPLIVTNELDELEVSAEYEIGSGSSRMDFTFERTVEDEDEDEDDLWLVTTRISWSDRGREISDSVEQYVYFDDEEADVK